MRIALMAGAALLVLVQFVPVERSNPPVSSEIEAPAAIQSLFERACYDCHSNQTHWPWYSRVAPVSWLVTHDVEEGREHLNFSTWGELDPEERADLRREIGEEVEEGEMPLWFYLPLHPEARLEEAERAALDAWARAADSGKARLAEPGG